MERVYKDPELGIKMQRLPTPGRKLMSRYNCPVWRAPRADPDSTAAPAEGMPEEGAPAGDGQQEI